MKKFVIALALLYMAVACGKKEGHDEHMGHHAQSAAASARNYADSVNAGIIPVDTLKQSVMRTAMEFIGDNHVHIAYGSPGVRGRTIWGGLVAYDEVWVAGAHHATSVEFSKDVIVDGKIIPAGKYALFVIPGKTDWIIILNKNWDQHLADEYSSQEDVLRVAVKPGIQNEITQRLTYSVELVSNSEGELVMTWDRIQLRIPFVNKK